MVDTVEKTVDSTVVDNVERNLFSLFKYSILAVNSLTAMRAEPVLK
jgi:hypothetical protein